MDMKAYIFYSIDESTLWVTFLHFFPCRNAAHGFSLIPVDSLKITMKEILQKALKKRKGSQKGSGKVPAESPDMLRSSPNQALELSNPEMPFWVKDVKKWACLRNN